MREVKVEGKVYIIRGLKRKEVKALRKKGLAPLDVTPEKLDDVVDEALRLVLNKKEFESLDDLDNASVLKLWDALLRETYPAADEIKNS